MSKILVYYRFEETSISGGILVTRRVEQDEIKGFLNTLELPRDQIENALLITTQTPNVPYDLHKAHRDGAIYWTARLTLRVHYDAPIF